MAIDGATALAAGLCMFTGVGAALGISGATTNAVEYTARQPEGTDKIQRILVLGAALAEATAIYAFIIALMLLLVR